MYEEAILEHIEIILLNEMGKAAADSVTKSLQSLSSATTSTALSDIKDAPEKVEKTEDKEKILLDINVNWKNIARIASCVIESIPNSLPKNSHTLHMHVPMPKTLYTCLFYYQHTNVY